MTRTRVVAAVVVVVALAGVAAALLLWRTPEPAPLAAPAVVTAVAGPVGSSTVVVEWAVVDGAADYEAVAGDGAASCESATTSCTIEGVPQGVTVRAQVVARDGTRRSEPTRSTPVFVPGPTGFDDVPDGAFFADAVSWLRSRGITSGYGGNTALFNPDGALTRAELALFLHRTFGSPAAPRSHAFPDLPASGELADAVGWLVARGVTIDGGGSLFDPGAIVSRGDLATALFVVAGSPSVESSAPFTDVEVGDAAEPAVAWLAAFGVTTGFGGDATRFAPDVTMTRAQLATFLYRLASTPDAWQTEPPTL